MTDFNNMTLMAALKIIEVFHSHSDLESLEVGDIHGRCRTSSKSAHITDLGKIALDENPEVLTLAGKMKIKGFMSRMHPEGNTGLSEEDDAAFRLQITLITERLLSRRFNKHKRLT